MREFLIIFTSIIGIGGASAVLLFMLIFPVVNKLFRLNLPCFHGVWDEVELNPIFKEKKSENNMLEKEKKESTEKDDKSSNISDKKDDVKETKKAEVPKNNRESNTKTKNNIAKRTDELNPRNSTKSVASKPVYYDDKSVPTIKIPPVVKAPEKEIPLTLAKIEAASKKTTVMIDGQTFMEQNMENKQSKPTKPRARKEDVDRVLKEKKLEEQREKLKQKMAENEKKAK